MKTKFEITILGTSRALVILKSYLRFHDVVNDVQKALNDASFKGEVVIDMLLANGLDNRFYIVPFNNEFDYKSIYEEPIPDESVYRTSNLFFKNNIGVLNNGVLSNDEKEFIFSNL